jgi:hypothetical protein
MDPIRFHWFGGFHVVVRRGQDVSYTHLLCNPTGFAADPYG